MFKKNIKNLIIKLIDILFSPLVYISSVLFKFIRSKGVERMTISRRIFRSVGVFPVTDSYYDPLVKPEELKHSLSDDRTLDFIDFHIEDQLSLLKQFNYQDEIEELDLENLLNSTQHQGRFPFFLPTEAEYYYSTIRHFKPKKIIEIGSGFSTKIALKGIEGNLMENNEYSCRLICVEPYENPWLEKTEAEIIRKKVQDVDFSLVESLNENDILFIDSSHIIKPQGDVLYEYQQILPALKTGVLIHVHDIFTPKDYPARWIIDKGSFFNEQYLLESFLMFNDKFKIIGSLNYLKHHYFKEASETLKSLLVYPEQESSSFWFKVLP